MLGRDDLVTAARLAAGLPGFLRAPLTIDAARAIVQRRLDRRADDLLALLRRLAAQPGNPYQRLLRHAGCETGDLVALVRREGVDGALRALLRQGVYLSLEEVKARRPVVRGALTFTVAPAALHNPAVRVVVTSRSSGSRGAGTAVPMDLAHLRDRAANTLLAMDARGGAGWTKGQWLVPGGGAVAQLLEFSAFGAPVRRWFTQVAPEGLASRYRWSARLVRWGSLAAGIPLPGPEHAPFEAPGAILDWLEAVRRGGVTPHLFTFASSALRLADAAARRGQDLAGVQLTVTGEPLTPARQAALRAHGAIARPRYAITECGAVGYGCSAPVEPDEVHVPLDLHGLIQAAADGPPLGLSPRALLVTALRPTAPLALLNVHLGDEARLGTRDCGCALEGLGWTTPLHGIRSDQKLTAGGMTFLHVDVLRILEEVLPARCGGGPGDYQLVEDETADGRPRVRLLMRPGVGPADPATVARAFLDALGAGSAAEAVMRRAWDAAQLLTVERQAPLALPSGKLRPVHAPSRRG
jgi:hypothetical protein